MEQVILALSALVINIITGGTKKLQSIKLSPAKKGLLRVIVAILSVLSAIGMAWMSDGEIDVNSIQTAVNAIVTFLVSQGLYLVAKK